MDEIVSLNVGGKIFQTMRSTLKTFPESFFGRMFAEGQTIPSTKDKDGNYFIDRSYEYFDNILSMYRSGSIPGDAYGQLRREIKFYFPGHFSITDDQKEAKRYARCLFDYWEIQNHEEGAEWYTIREYVVPWVSWAPALPSCLTGHISTKSESEYFGSYRSGKNVPINFIELITASIRTPDKIEEVVIRYARPPCTTRLAHSENISAIFADKDMRVKLDLIWKRLIEFSTRIGKETFLELVCRFLQKLVGVEFIVEWRESLHTCGEQWDENCNWSGVTLTGRNKKHIPKYFGLPPSLFEGILPESKNPIGFPPCWPVSLRTRYIIVHPRLRYGSDYIADEPEKESKVENSSPKPQSKKQRNK